jgi:hypothetical protein
MIEKVSAEIKSAMKSKDSARLTTLRGLMSEAKNIAINDKRKDVSSDDLVTALTKGIKQREDSYTSYKDAGRSDLADKEIYEINVLKEFQPKQLTELELISMVDDVIATLGVVTKKDMGKVMGEVMKSIPKGSVDNKIVSKIVGSKLN